MSMNTEHEHGISFRDLIRSWPHNILAIIPYKGVQTNHIGNGLLLRGDWHTLFDVRLVTVDPETMCLMVTST